jgi:hypothetical protein
VKLDIKSHYEGEWRKGKTYDAINDSVYSQADKALFKIRIDSLNNEIIKVRNLLTAIYQKDIDLAKQKKYGELLAGKKWSGQINFLQKITYNFGDGTMVRNITAEFGMRQEIEFITIGDHIDAIIKENLILPEAAQKLSNGGYVLLDKYGSNRFGVAEYNSKSYVTSTYTTSTQNFNWPNFKLSYSAYSSNYAAVNKMPLYLNDEYCKNYIDKYMIYLTKCNFTFYLKEGKLVLSGIDKSGSQIDFDYENTPAQIQLNSRKSDLQYQITLLQKRINNG